MSGYCFRLKFRMVTQLDLPTQPCSFSAPPIVQTSQISSNEPRVPGVDQWIAIKSCGFTSHEEAENAAIRLKDAILIVGSENLGADFGLNKVRSRLSEEIKRDIKEKHGTIIRDEVHGIDVFQDGDVRHFEVTAAASVHTEITKFAERLVEASKLPGLTSVTRTGAELINDSLFTMPDEARFLLRVSAIEALCEQRQRPPPIQVLINQLISVARCLAADDSALTTITNWLEEARRESVGQACRARIRLHLGDQAVRDFNRLYGLRSKYLHEGLGRGQFAEPASEAMQIARSLLVAEIKGTAAYSEPPGVAGAAASQRCPSWRRTRMLVRRLRVLLCIARSPL